MGEHDPALQRLVDPTTIPDGLTPTQAEAARRPGAVLVLAGAGTGKTKTLTAGVALRIAERGIRSHRILAVTFTNKAAAEMRRRIVALLGGQTAPSWIGTFHGLGARQLRLEPQAAGLRDGFDILDADDARRLLQRTIRVMDLEDLAREDDGSRNALKTISATIGWFKDNLILPRESTQHAEAAIARDPAADVDALRLAARIYPEYQRRLREANAADFGDLLLWPTRGMATDPDLRRRLAGRFDCLLADEYQDVNAAQYRWLRLMAEAHGEIFVVGDDDQAVFGFRGADIAYIRNFVRDFPGASQIRLEENFRSTGHIIGAANAIIAQDSERLGKTLRSTRSEGRPVEVVRFRNDEAEAHGIVAEIQQRHREGVAWDRIAILYRANFLSRSFEEALLHAHVPHVLVGDFGFYQRAEIKDAMALLRLAANPDDSQSDEAFRRVYNTPRRGIGEKALDAIEEHAAWRRCSLLTACETAPLPPRVRSTAAAFADMIRAVAANREATVADRIALLLDRSGYRTMLRESRAETSAGRLENLSELIALAGSFHTSSDLLDHAALASASPAEATTGRVQLLTLHRAKGLEFDHVFLPAWDAGVFPTQYGDPAEERRLAYVAITRARDRLAISHVEFRHGYTDPSPFLDDIPEEHRHKGWLRTPSREETRREIAAKTRASLQALDEMLARALTTSSAFRAGRSRSGRLTANGPRSGCPRSAGSSSPTPGRWRES